MRNCTILPSNAKDNDILLKNLLDVGAILLDVRTNHEYVGFHLPNARNISPEYLSSYVDKIKSWKKPIIVYSTYGLRSKLACLILHKEGIEVYDAGAQARVKALLRDFN